LCRLIFFANAIKNYRKLEINREFVSLNWEVSKIDVIKRRWVLILILAGLIIVGSFYGQWQKSTVEDVVSTPIYEPSNNSMVDATNAGSGKVNINSADKDELDKLPGIGPVLAGRIVEFRKVNGPFHNISDLTRVPGISSAKFKKIESKLVR